MRHICPEVGADDTVPCRAILRIEDLFNMPRDVLLVLELLRRGLRYRLRILPHLTVLVHVCDRLVGDATALQRFAHGAELSPMPEREGQRIGSLSLRMTTVAAVKSFLRLNSNLIIFTRNENFDLKQLKIKIKMQRWT